MNDVAQAPESGRLAERARTVRLLRASRREKLPPHLFGEPGWDILLALAEINGRGRPACPEELAEKISQPVSATIRWLQELLCHGIIRVDAENTTVQLSEKGARALEDALANFA